MKNSIKLHCINNIYHCRRIFSLLFCCISSLLKCRHCSNFNYLYYYWFNYICILYKNRFHHDGWVIIYVRIKSFWNWDIILDVWSWKSWFYHFMYFSSIVIWIVFGLWYITYSWKKWMKIKCGWLYFRKFVFIYRYNYYIS